MAELTDGNIYAWFAGIHDYLRPPVAEIYYQQRKAERRKWGYSMQKGKPGTFRANGWVPYGQIIIFDEEAMEAAWKRQNSSLRFADTELHIGNTQEPMSTVRTSSTVVDISNGLNP